MSDVWEDEKERMESDRVGGSDRRVGERRQRLLERVVRREKRKGSQERSEDIFIQTWVSLAKTRVCEISAPRKGDTIADEFEPRNNAGPKPGKGRKKAVE